MSSVTRIKSINYTALTPCTTRRVEFYSTSSAHDGDAGLVCDGNCPHNAVWCNDKRDGFCDDSGVRTTDPGLCSDPTFWQEISCNWTEFGQLYAGVGCTGAIKQCYYPQGSPTADWYPTTCRDKSDRVFQVGEPCPDTPDNICWESCDIPGPGCLACTNTTYFTCPQTNQCLHPSLKCDGIPQCTGVDELLDECKLQYSNNDAEDGRHKISKHATFRCKRKMYPELETFATPCDGNPECNEEKDEKNCNQASSFIKHSLISIAIIYLVLKYGRKLYRKLSKTHMAIKRRYNETMIIKIIF